MFLTLKVTLFVLGAFYAQSNAARIKFCLEDSNSLEKCLALESALRTKQANAAFECVPSQNCTKHVADGLADATVIDADEHPNVLEKLEAVLFESYDDNNLIVALIDADKVNQLNDLPLSYDKKDIRLFHSALYINYYRNGRKCVKIPRKNDFKIVLERYHEIKDAKNKKLVCIENEKLVIKPISQFKDCHVEANIPNAVMIKKDSSKKDDVIQAFLIAAESVGRGGEFELFGPFRQISNLIFRDETKALQKYHSEPNGISVGKFLDLHCGDTKNHDHAHDHYHHY